MMLLSLLLILFLTKISLAQEILVEASKINPEKIEPSRNTTILTEQNWDTKKPQTVADILREVPGLEVIRQGPVGQTTSVFIRGARAEDTLVLIDGIEANDAMSPSCGFDFSTLSPTHIERIEIYRGPQSVRFGASALGGVINIITKEGHYKPRTEYLLESGSFATSRLAFSRSAAKQKFAYAFSGETFSSAGFSAAAKKKGNTEADGAQFYSAIAKMAWRPDAISKVAASARYNEAYTEIDRQGGVGGDDPNNSTKARQTVASIAGSRRFFQEQLNSTLGFYFSEVERRGQNKPDSLSTTDSSDYFLSENHKIASSHEFSLGEHHTLQGTLDWRNESGRSQSHLAGTTTMIPRRTQAVGGGALTYLFDNEKWFFDLGSRLDHSTNIKFIASYRGSFGRQWLEQKAKIFVSYGTGYKLPSLYQLYSKYGDQNLNEETSTTLELTIEKTSKNFSHTLAFFKNDYSQLIDFDMTANKYFNIAKAQSQGFELQSTANLNSSLKLEGRYTYLDTFDKTTNQSLLRRPRNTWTATSRYFLKEHELYIQFLFKGERLDVDPNSLQKITANAYELLNIGGNYKFSDKLKAHLRIENIFNRTYEEVAGYGTPGLSFYAGVSGDLQ